MGCARRGTFACATSAVPGHRSCALAGVPSMARQARYPSVIAIRNTLKASLSPSLPLLLGTRRQLRMAYARLRAANASEGAPGLRRQKSPGIVRTVGTRCATRRVATCLVCCRSRAAGAAPNRASGATPDAVGQYAKLAPDHVYFMAAVEGRACRHIRA